jgi:hypothetical protein
MTDPIEADIDRQIAFTHTRFVAAMEQRLPHMHIETKERYFAALSILVSRLADTDKPIREVLRESVAEAAVVIMQEFGG